ncbi:MAG: helix-turn-helix transcriptional regulator, partial [Deltaproteobacteria bacterium]|nr:helix-turn-helix transcriptional regulator [Deltaproteobacteria bacterium]
GEQYFSHDIRSLLPQRDVKTMQQGGGVDPLEALSPREREIFHLLAGGMQNAAIARKLFISPRTVETHRARIVRKLGIRTNSELIRFAIKNEVTFL